LTFIEFDPGYNELHQVRGSVYSFAGATHFDLGDYSP